MARQLKLAPAAQADLTSIWVFGAERWSPVQADLYLRDLDQIFDLLCAQPRIGRLRNELDPPVRAHHHQSHVVLYRFSDEALQVIRVVSARSNWQALRDL